MAHLAQEIGEMDSDNPLRPERLKDLHALADQ